jgi:hypothetical protein
MTQSIAASRIDLGPMPDTMWRYRWDIVMTSVEASGVVRFIRRVAHTADELSDIILHTSYDPRIVSYRYIRQPELDISGAPSTCGSCGSAYRNPSAYPAASNQQWQKCACNGHYILVCPSCDEMSVYPEYGPGCHLGKLPLEHLSQRRLDSYA